MLSGHVSGVKSCFMLAGCLLLSLLFNQRGFAQDTKRLPLRPSNPKSVSLLDEALNLIEKQDYSEAEKPLLESIRTESSGEAEFLKLHIKVMTHLKKCQPAKDSPHLSLPIEAGIMYSYLLLADIYAMSEGLRPRILDLHFESCVYVQGMFKVCISLCDIAKEPPGTLITDSLRTTNSLVGKTFKRILAHETKNKNFEMDFHLSFKEAEKDHSLMKKRLFLEKFIPVMVKNSHESKMLRLFVIALSVNEAHVGDGQLLQRAMATFCTFEKEHHVHLEKERDFVIDQINNIIFTLENGHFTDRNELNEMKQKKANWHRIKSFLDVVLVKQIPSGK